MKNPYEIRGDVTTIYIFNKKKKVTIETLIDTEDLIKIQEEITGKLSIALSYPSPDLVYVNYYDKKARRTRGFTRYLMNAPDGLVVDHINHNTLDNRKSNLRVVTQKENIKNRRLNRKG